MCVYTYIYGALNRYMYIHTMVLYVHTQTMVYIADACTYTYYGSRNTCMYIYTVYTYMVHLMNIYTHTYNGSLNRSIQTQWCV